VRGGQGRFLKRDENKDKVWIREIQGRELMRRMFETD
jgi:hypothetical protein